MTILQVAYKTVIDAMGRKRTGWVVLENGRPSYPHADKDAAIRAAKAIAVIRCKSPEIVTVLD